MGPCVQCGRASVWPLARRVLLDLSLCASYVLVPFPASCMLLGDKLLLEGEVDYPLTVSPLSADRLIARGRSGGGRHVHR